jgi:hypothetical protein
MLGESMHIHTVFFWLKDNVSPTQRQQFENGLDLLISDTNILDRKIGTPAATSRDVIDATYDYGIVLMFDSLAAHDRYQASQTHIEFLQNCATMWKRVQVYDIQT